MWTYRLVAVRNFLSAVIVGLVVSGCAANVAQHGNLPDPALVDDIQPGASTRDEVTQALGAPSSIATFGAETWYYIARRTETFAFYEPDLVDQKIVAITFDGSGVVTGIDHYGLDDAREVDMVSRVTPTGGKTLGFFEQIVGNLGRFVGQEPPAP